MLWLLFSGFCFCELSFCEGAIFLVLNSGEKREGKGDRRLQRRRQKNKQLHSRKLAAFKKRRRRRFRWTRRPSDNFPLQLYLFDSLLEAFSLAVDVFGLYSSILAALGNISVQFVSVSWGICADSFFILKSVMRRDFYAVCGLFDCGDVECFAETFCLVFWTQVALFLSSFPVEEENTPVLTDRRISFCCLLTLQNLSKKF